MATCSIVRKKTQTVIKKDCLEKTKVKERLERLEKLPESVVSLKNVMYVSENGTEGIKAKEERQPGCFEPQLEARIRMVEEEMEKDNIDVKKWHAAIEEVDKSYQFVFEPKCHFGKCGGSPTIDKTYFVHDVYFCQHHRMKIAEEFEKKVKKEQCYNKEVEELVETLKKSSDEEFLEKSKQSKLPSNYFPRLYAYFEYQRLCVCEQLAITSRTSPKYWEFKAKVIQLQEQAKSLLILRKMFNPFWNWFIDKVVAGGEMVASAAVTSGKMVANAVVAGGKKIVDTVRTHPYLTIAGVITVAAIVGTGIGFGTGLITLGGIKVVVLKGVVVGKKLGGLALKGAFILKENYPAIQKYLALSDLSRSLTLGMGGVGGMGGMVFTLSKVLSPTRQQEKIRSDNNVDSHPRQEANKKQRRVDNSNVQHRQEKEEEKKNEEKEENYSEMKPIEDGQVNVQEFTLDGAIDTVTTDLRRLTDEKKKLSETGKMLEEQLRNEDPNNKEKYENVAHQLRKTNEQLATKKIEIDDTVTVLQRLYLQKMTDFQDEKDEEPQSLESQRKIFQSVCKKAKELTDKCPSNSVHSISTLVYTNQLVSDRALQLATYEKEAESIGRFKIVSILTIKCPSGRGDFYDHCTHACGDDYTLSCTQLVRKIKNYFESDWKVNIFVYEDSPFCRWFCSSSNHWSKSLGGKKIHIWL